jgi:hypothetical protein
MVDYKDLLERLTLWPDAIRDCGQNIGTLAQDVEQGAQVLATTLEALDKAEAERDAMAKIIRWSLTQPASNFDGIMASLCAAVPVQPEPDPLVAVIQYLDDNPVTYDGPENYAKRLTEALARHGLAVKEVG